MPIRESAPLCLTRTLAGEGSKRLGVDHRPRPAYWALGRSFASRPVRKWLWGSAARGSQLWGKEKRRIFSSVTMSGNAPDASSATSSVLVRTGARTGPDRLHLQQTGPSMSGADASSVALTKMAHSQAVSACVPVAAKPGRWQPSPKRSHRGMRHSPSRQATLCRIGASRNASSGPWRDSRDRS